MHCWNPLYSGASSTIAGCKDARLCRRDPCFVANREPLTSTFFTLMSSLPSLLGYLGSGVLFLLFPMPYCNLVKPYRQPLQLQRIVGTCQIRMYRKTAKIMNADQVDALLESVKFRGFKYHRRMQGRTPLPLGSMFCCEQRASYFDFFHADVIPALSSWL